jgi:hypothetical protein
MFVVINAKTMEKAVNDTDYFLQNEGFCDGDCNKLFCHGKSDGGYEIEWDGLYEKFKPTNATELKEKIDGTENIVRKLTPSVMEYLLEYLSDCDWGEEIVMPEKRKIFYNWRHSKTEKKIIKQIAKTKKYWIIPINYHY